ncbi:DUF6531 domain-containing protein [Saccharopolyspora sp. SCSIO 74807]|uniref:DUF6531 domain-containing protein n=1 Tax=Saccharopolyspora sp. SCSIO 74807 TaxID=3118084 RepID=UPI0030D05C54
MATLIARIPQWAAELGGTLGIATPHVVASAVTLISRWVTKITDLITQLTRSLEKLSPLLSKLGTIWDDIHTALRRALRGGDSPAPTGSTHAKNTPDTPDTGPGGTEPADADTPGDTTGPAPGAGSRGRSDRQGPDVSGDRVGGQRTDGNRGCDGKGGDPVDAVSGQVIANGVDVDLPGLLPLVLQRAYASGYVGGRL